MNAITSIRSRLQTLLWEGHLSEYILQRVKEYTDVPALYNALCPATLESTWYWPDINYADQTDSTWQTMEHNARLLLILCSYGKEKLENDPVFAEKMVGAFRYWLLQDFSNPNWWHNDISVPRVTADITFMLYPLLDQPLLDRAAQLTGRGSMDLHPEFAENWTGANLIWCAANTIRRALLTGNTQLIADAVGCAEKAIDIGKVQGIQEDGSFFQHGRRLYSGGYGRSFAYDIAQLAYMLQSTPYQLSSQKLEIFQTHILDGLRHMTQGKGLDYCCVGRELCRVDGVAVGLVHRAVAMLAKTQAIPRAAETEAYLKMMEDGISPEMTKYFPQAAMLCHHTGGIYIGAKFTDHNLRGMESIHGEARLCYNMSYGTHNCIMKDGEEYRNLTAVWDFCRIPGTTARIESESALENAHGDWVRYSLPSDHAGGKQNGSRAVIYELAQHDGIRAYVANFAFEGGLVCLGCGIEDEKGDVSQLVTTVDQCLYRGSLTENDGSLSHNGICYRSLNGTKLEFMAENKTGAYRRNNQSGANTPITIPVLTVTARRTGKETQQYAYMIHPADRTAQVEVLSNTPAVQAIRLADGSVMAVFHQPGNLCSIRSTAGCYIETK